MAGGGGGGHMVCGDPFETVTDVINNTAANLVFCGFFILACILFGAMTAVDLPLAAGIIAGGAILAGVTYVINKIYDFFDWLINKRHENQNTIAPANVSTVNTTHRITRRHPNNSSALALRELQSNRELHSNIRNNMAHHHEIHQSNSERSEEIYRQQRVELLEYAAANDEVVLPAAVASAAPQRRLRS